jgi:hypothetical protein
VEENSAERRDADAIHQGAIMLLQFLLPRRQA